MSEFQLIAGHPALDFVNTYDNRFRPGFEEELLPAYADLLRFAAESGLLDGAEKRTLRLNCNDRDHAAALAAAHELREALAEALYSQVDGTSPPPRCLATLERYFKDAAESRALLWKAGRAFWTWPSRSNNAQLPVWKLAGAAEQLLLSETVARVHSCEALACRWLFLDSSKNHTRRWCDMKLCGNRMKARRHQAKLVPPARKLPQTGNRA